MKTAILHCNSYDDGVSLRDQLRRVKTGDVLLVMPSRDAPRLTRLDLIQLKRQADKQHLSLALVTRDAGLRLEAGRAGLVAYEDTTDARQAIGKEITTRTPLRSRYAVTTIRKGIRRPVDKRLPDWLRWLVFSIAMVILLAAILSLMPSARIVLNLPRENQAVDLELVASVDTKITDLIAGIPLYPLEGDQQVTLIQPATGSIQVGDQPARGDVLFTNLTDREQQIPAGTILRLVGPEAIRFQVKAGGSLAAGPGQTISLVVEEMDGIGPGGNLATGSTLALDPPLDEFITSSNPLPFSGGSLKTVRSVSGSDLQTADQALRTALRDDFLENAAGRLPEGGVLIPESISIVTFELESALPNEGVALDRFTASGQASLRGFYYLTTDLEHWAQLAMDAMLVPGNAGLEGTLKVNITKLAWDDQQAASISLQAFREFTATFDSRSVFPDLVGKQPAEVKYLLVTRYFPDSQPVIELSPSWWPRLPFFPMRIRIDG